MACHWKSFVPNLETFVFSIINQNFPQIKAYKFDSGRSQQLSSIPRTLESWVRLSPEAWMSVCFYSVCVAPVQRVPLTVQKTKKLERRPRAVEPWMTNMTATWVQTLFQVFSTDSRCILLLRGKHTYIWAIITHASLWWYRVGGGSQKCIPHTYV
jgi:hypothetical protein